MALLGLRSHVPEPFGSYFDVCVHEGTRVDDKNPALPLTIYHNSHSLVSLVMQDLYHQP